MTPEQFAYWLNGFIELSEWKQPTPEQWKSICEHLKTVFVKVTPPVRTEGPMVAAPARQPGYEEILRALQLKDAVSWPGQGIPGWPGLGTPPAITC